VKSSFSSDRLYVCCLFFCNSLSSVFVLLSVDTLNQAGSTFHSNDEW